MWNSSWEDDLSSHIADELRMEDMMYQIACDEIIHTDEQPICGDMSCPCHEQVIEYMPAPWSDEMQEQYEAERAWGARWNDELKTWVGSAQ